MLQSVEQYIEHVINNLLPTMLEEVMRAIAQEYSENVDAQHRLL